MHSANYPPFQINASYGIVGAMLAMLMTDLPQTIAPILGPAIPPSWSRGSFKGLVVTSRGGGVLDFSWDADSTATSTKWKSTRKPRTVVNVHGTVLPAS